MKKVIVISLFVGALGVILTGFKKYVAAITIEMKVVGTWMLRKRKQHHKYCYHYSRICEIFDNILEKQQCFSICVQSYSPNTVQSKVRPNVESIYKFL